MQWKAKRDCNVGKRIAGALYVHKSAIGLLPEDMRQLANQAVKRIPETFGDYEVIKIEQKLGVVACIKSNNFLTASEPTVGDRIVIVPGKEPEVRPSNNKLIFHHKWLMVPDDYPEFDVEEEKQWSEFWKNSDIPEAKETSRIGRKDFWEKVLSKLPGWGIRFTREEMRIANGTSRGKGAVGANALVPRYIDEEIKPGPGEHILDFGAGKHAIHTQMFKDKGYLITAYDFSSNFDPNLHDRGALAKTYDYVLLSNVVNVQNSEDMLRRTLRQVNSVIKPGGKVVLNYPASPRKASLSTGQVRSALGQEIGNPDLVGGQSNTPVWEIKVA